MTLDRALNFVIDYTKFITALWASYIAFNVTIIGWLLTLRGTNIVLGWLAGIVVIFTYLGVSFIFREVLRQNHERLLGLMDVVDVLAEAEASAHPELKRVKEVYGRVFKTGNAAELLERTAGPYLSGVAVVAALFMALITFLPKPPIPPPSAAAATQVAPAR